MIAIIKDIAAWLKLKACGCGYTWPLKLIEEYTRIQNRQIDYGIYCDGVCGDAFYLAGARVPRVPKNNYLNFSRE